MFKSIVISGAWVSIGILLGRVAGFFREVTVANIFGVSSAADIAIFTLILPDLLVSILVAGGLSAALIPEFKRYNKNNAGILFIQSSMLAVFVFALVAFILVFLSDKLVMIFAPGFDANIAEKTSEMLNIVLWLLPFTVLAGVSTAYLQSMDRFSMPAMGTLIFNACILLGMYSFVNGAEDLSLFAWFIILGGVARWFSQLWVLRGDFFLSQFNSSILLSKKLFYRYYQAVIALGVLSFFPVVVRAFASFEGEGGMAIANYALRLIELPLGVVITIFSVVLFPRLASCYEKGDKSGFTSLLSEGLVWSVVVALSVMGAMIVASDNYVALVYGWGNISNEELAKISLIMTIGIISLPLQAVSSMLIAAFNAQHDTKTPMYVSLLGFLFLLVACWQGELMFGLKGVVATLVISYLFVSTSLIIMLSYRKSEFFNIKKLLILLFWPALLSSAISILGTYSASLFIKKDILLVVSSLIFVLISLLAVAILTPRYKLLALIRSRFKGSNI